MRRPELTVKQILEWADSHRERTGRWPERNDGQVAEAIGERWVNVDQALRKGLRGLHRGQSLARLLAKHRGKRNRKALPKYTVNQILNWADADHARTGRWPHNLDGSIRSAPGETWWAVDMALRNGLRGLPGGSSLARLLDARRGVTNRLAPPRLTMSQILDWADRHQRRTGIWPNIRSGAITQSKGETWQSIDRALRHGRRGLRRSSLARLLTRHRHVPRHVRQRPLSPDHILRWADDHFARTGKWPREASGPIPEAPGDTWQRMHSALLAGRRGLPGGETLTHFIAVRRRLRTRVTLPELTEHQILFWARTFHRRHGQWPTRKDGLIPRSHGDTWCAVDLALKRGRRGLKGRKTLSQLIRHAMKLPGNRLSRRKAARPSSP